MKPAQILLGGMAFLAFALFAPLQAVPNLVPYQGQVAVDGVLFEGSGTFKFALVNEAGDDTYWSNDGTSTAGSEPTAGVALNVSRGNYSVTLGETAIPNMTALPVTVFQSYSDVFLRVWFDDGSNGSQLLTPDQRISAVAFALTAAHADTADEAGVATTVTNGGVTTTMLSDDAVTAAKIADNAVSGAAILDGSIEFGDINGLSAPGTDNFFAGPSTGNPATTGTKNTAFGTGALSVNTSGENNTAVGRNAMINNTTGNGNTGIGEGVLASNQTGSNNNAFGSGALGLNVAGDDNVAMGNVSLFKANSNRNTAIGAAAQFQTTTGTNNAALGGFALWQNTTGSHNIALGDDAGSNLTTGSNNIMIGNAGLPAEENTIRIGTSNQTKAFITGIHGVTPAGAGAPVVIDENGQLGTAPAVYRYAVWSTRDNAGAYLFGDQSAMTGGIPPSQWHNSPIVAGQISSDKKIQAALFNKKATVAPNSNVWTESYLGYSAYTKRFAGVLFRVRNPTGSPINWTLRFHASAYGSWQEYASLALNGGNIWQVSSSNANNIHTVNLSIPANRISTVILVVGSSPYTNLGNNIVARTVYLGFRDNSLTLPAGLEYVDDLDTATGGYEQ